MNNQHPYHTWTAETAQTATRDQLIAWLVWNDPNGCYRDDDAEEEGFDVLTRETALDIVLRQLAG
jgi:hypothetical protein